MTLLGYSQISQHLPPPKTETQALPESQVASEVHVSRQLVVSAQTGAPDTSDTQGSGGRRSQMPHALTPAASRDQEAPDIGDDRL